MKHVWYWLILGEWSSLHHLPHPPSLELLVTTNTSEVQLLCGVLRALNTVGKKLRLALRTAQKQLFAELQFPAQRKSKTRGYCKALFNTSTIQ